MSGRAGRKASRQGETLAGDALARLLDRAGLAHRALGHGRGAHARERAVRPAPLRGRGRDDPAPRGPAPRLGTWAGGRGGTFATIVATHLAAAVPLGTLLAGEPLHLPIRPRARSSPRRTAGRARSSCRRRPHTGRPPRRPSPDDTWSRRSGPSSTSSPTSAAAVAGACGTSSRPASATSAASTPGVRACCPGPVVEGLLDEVIAATAPHVTRRPELRAYRHARGSYRTVVFRGCCLGYRLDGEGCPFCPRYPASRQHREVAAWLDTLPVGELLRGIPAAA